MRSNKQIGIDWGYYILIMIQIEYIYCNMHATTQKYLIKFYLTLMAF